jgi:hypothetical protein
MKRWFGSLAALCLLFGVLSTAMAGSHEMPPNPERDPEGTAVHMAYECNTFTPGKPNTHVPGADLNGPGDMYRYTLIRDDKYANDPSYEIIKAIVGVHVDDYDWNKDSGDTKPEWGKILINGKAMEYMIVFPGDKRKPASSEFVEIVSDAEITPKGLPLMPPYIFNVLEEAKKGKTITFEVTNLRKDGSVKGSAEFGNFVVNRIGYHVYYKKK